MGYYDLFRFFMFKEKRGVIDTNKNPTRFIVNQR